MIHLCLYRGQATHIPTMPSHSRSIHDEKSSIMKYGEYLCEYNWHLWANKIHLNANFNFLQLLPFITTLL
jgi:hypothetical protein